MKAASTCLPGQEKGRGLGIRKWNHNIFRQFRKEFGLSKSELCRLLQFNGIKELNWATYCRWENGIPVGGGGRRKVVPHPAYQDAILRSLAEIRKKLELEARE